MMWVDISVHPLPKAGKYTVKTKSTIRFPLSDTGADVPSKHIATLQDIELSFDNKGKPSWSCKNQQVTHYLWNCNDKCN